MGKWWRSTDEGGTETVMTAVLSQSQAEMSRVMQFLLIGFCIRTEIES